jgi:hypothetical protein
MAETSKPAQPVGRARRIFGYVLMGFGGYLWLISVWNFMAYAPLFNYEDWLRLWVFVWTGAVLMPIGYWLKFRSRAALWSAAVVFVGEVAFLAWFDHWVHQQPIPPHQMQ